jgi:2-keto-4-pentenoate hydratase/2-oxohepta-3-ene-1,7-dioic acid hydratase in catechol pathway
LKLTTGHTVWGNRLIAQIDGQLVNVTETLGLPKLNCVTSLIEAGISETELSSMLNSRRRYIVLIDDDDELTNLINKPVLVPSKIICVGLNYLSHIHERANPPASIPELTLFAKTCNSLAGPYQNVHVPQSFRQLDWEGELAVIISRHCKHIHREDWRNVVYGYTVANDISERSLQHKTPQWFAGKSLDESCPLGPWIVTSPEIVDPQNLLLSTCVNGEVMQSANTDMMIYRIPELIEFVTSFATLEAGDVILTGTPSGVGLHRVPPVFLQSGDVVEVTIEGIGTIRNQITFY